MQSLLQRIQYYDDQKAFKQLYQLLFFKLYQFAYAYVRSRECAEEVVNDVFLGLWQKRNTADTISNIQVYLYVAVKNASLNELRKRKITAPVSLDELEVHHLLITANPESLLITGELKTRIREAVDRLPPRSRLIFKLVKEDGLTYRETAAILNISVKTVDAQLYLALKKLAHTLLPVWNDYKEREMEHKSSGN